MTAAIQPDRPYRVCHLVATTLGARWMYEQLRELRDRHGYEVSAVVNRNEGPLVDWLKAAGIPFHVWDFGLEGGLRSWSLLRSMFQLVRLLRKERYDVVQTHVFLSLLAARPAAWIAGVPVRLAMIAGPFHLEAKASRLVERLTWWMDTCLIPTCEKSLRLCSGLGIPDENLRLIYYSADENRFRREEVKPAGLRQRFGWPEDTPVIVLIAYFYPRLSAGDWIPDNLHGAAFKGHDDFIRAAGHVLKEFPKARFVLVGGGFAGNSDLLEEMKALTTRLNLDGPVVFTGHTPETPGVLRDATIAVQAALCENLGGTLEALSMASPMVVTRVGGMIDVVRDGVTGLVAEPRNPEDLARKICAMLREPERAVEMGLRGRDLVRERFSLRRTVDDLNTLYLEQIAVARSRGGAYSLLRTLARAGFGIPWLALVWTRATFAPGPWRHTFHTLPPRLYRLPVTAFRKIRLELHLIKAASERWSYRIWVAFAPMPVRRIARRLRAWTLARRSNT